MSRRVVDQALTEEAITAANMRYLAVMHRRAAPPRCHPITILVMVMSSGLIFIGLTMTIIAHWPGSTSIGENPLKIAGPILLSVGVVGFIVGIVLVSLCNKRDQRKFTKSINNLAASKVAMNQSAASLTGTSKKMPPEPSAPAGVYHDEVQQHQAVNAESSRLTTVVRTSQNYHGTGVRSVGSKESYASGQNSDEVDDIPQPIRIRKTKKTVTDSSDNVTSEESKELLASSTKLKESQYNSTKSSAAQSSSVVKTEEYSVTTTNVKSYQSNDQSSPQSGVVYGAGLDSPSAQRLRLHVKAPAGSTVQIQQGTRDKTLNKSLNKSTTSIETDF